MANSNNPQPLNIPRFPNMPLGVNNIANKLTIVNSDEYALFIDSDLQPVGWPYDQEPKNTYHLNYLRALWELRKGYIRIGNDNTFYTRVDNTNMVLLNHWQAFDNIETAWNVPRTKQIETMNEVFQRHCQTLPHVKRGMRFGNIAYTSNVKTGVTKTTATPDDPYMWSSDAEWMNNPQQRIQIIQQAQTYLKWLTADEGSYANLMRMFATPFLEPYKHLMYIMYGKGGDGKSFLLRKLGETHPGETSGISLKRICTNGFTSEQETAQIVGKYWVFDEESDTLEEHMMETVKKICTGDTMTGRFIQGNSFKFRPKATLIMATNSGISTALVEANMRRMVKIRMSGKKTAQEMQPLEEFIDQYGMVPFMVASALQWEYDANDFAQVEIGDSDRMGDWEAWATVQIMSNGYAPSNNAPCRAPYGAVNKMGLTRSWRSLNGVKFPAYIVQDEGRFTPYREWYEQQEKEKTIPQPVITPSAQKMNNLMVEQLGQGEIITLNTPEGYECTQAHEPVKDNPKAVLNWKKQDKSDSVDLAEGQLYAVIPDAHHMIIDLDAPKHEGEVSGWDTIGSLCVPTHTVRTPHDGLHLYYRIPDEYVGKVKNRNHPQDANGNLIPVDVKASGKGYVLGVGSTTPDGMYVMVDNQKPVEAPSELMKWLDMNGYLDTPQTTVRRPFKRFLGAYVSNSVSEHFNKPDLSDPKYSEGSRNESLCKEWLWAQLQNHSDERKQIYDCLMESGLQIGLSEQELNAAWRTAVKKL